MSKLKGVNKMGGDLSNEVKIDSDSLYHFGIRGMKWGIRRYQNPDGTLTTAGKKRYGSEENLRLVQQAKANIRTQKELDKINRKYNGKLSQKSVKQMSNDELQDEITRLQLEQKLSSLRPSQVSLGKKIFGHVSDVAIPAVKEAGRTQLTKLLNRQLEKAFGNNKVSAAKTAMEQLRELDEKTRLRRQIKDNLDILNGKNSDDLSRLAKEYQNRRTIDSAQQYFKEGPYSDNNSNNSRGNGSEQRDNNSSSRNNSNSGSSSNIHVNRGPRVNSFRSYANPDIVGEGTSRYDGSRKSSTLDAEEGKDWFNVTQYPSTQVSNITVDRTNTGRDYVQKLLSTNSGTQLLLEDKTNR